MPNIDKTNIGDLAEAIAIGRLAEKGVLACKNIAAQWTGRFDLFADMEGHRIEVKSTLAKGNSAAVAIKISNMDNFDHLVAVFYRDERWDVFKISRAEFMVNANGNPDLNESGKNDRWLYIKDFLRLVEEGVAEQL